MIKKKLFMVGPTVIPERVLDAMNRQIFSHRSDEYYKVHKRLGENLKKLFGTSNDVIILTCSGTGAMEAAMQNCFKQGDKVVVPVIGEFSERYAIMAERYGLNTKRVNFELGETADVDKVMDSIDKDTKGVFVVHNESATGVYNDIEKFGEALRDTDILLICDSVSGLGGLPMKMDKWGVDVVFTSSQKALMSPPGLAFIALSDKAWDKVNSNDSYRFYFDLKEARKFHEKDQTPWTPAITTIVGADEALQMIMEEGIDNVYNRHRLNSKLVIKGVKDLGLSMFPKDLNYASPTVNTIYVPGKAKEIVSKLAEQGIIVSGGQGILADDTFRVGTMGYTDEIDVAAFLYVLEKILGREEGYYEG